MSEKEAFADQEKVFDKPRKEILSALGIEINYKVCIIKTKKNEKK